MRISPSLLLFSLPYAMCSQAGVADVEKVSVSCESRCSFSVSVRHSDSGWEHYADRWDILAPDGSVIATRVLYHPHVQEQPFTRSLGNVEIPDSVHEVTVRAHDSVHGYGGREVTLTLPSRDGSDH